MKIVLDTNVLISAVIKKSPTIRAVLDACRDGNITLVLSRPILQEFGRVMHKPNIQKYHQMTDAQISQYISDLSTFVELAEGTTPIEVSQDPKDNMFFSCAVESGADYLVSGDEKHILSIPVYQGVKTMSPTQFVQEVLKITR